jgi:hypothetical protein
VPEARARSGRASGYTGLNELRAVVLQYSASPAELVAESEAEEARRRGEVLKVQEVAADS